MNTFSVEGDGLSQNGCFKKAKHVKISENKHFLPPDTHTCHGVRNIYFSVICASFAFLKLPF